ncbi:MAG TPA: hypothetical protein VM938_12805 [Acidimicrobiales bacterium]|nr:hypothetical protein [Acidimicrobiales bacterium]
MKRALVVAVIALVVATVSGASALWLSRGDGFGTAGSDSLPGGAVPAAVVTSRSVALSWSAAAFKDGQAATSYTVSRYAAASGGAPVATLSCAPTSCTETAVAPGTWHYSVTPTYAAWTGAESARGSATVGSPSLTLSPSTISSVPATLTGTAANLIAGETVTFRLDNPTSGTVLTGTLAGGATVPASGGGAVSVTIPAGTSTGPHTVYLIGSAEGAVPPASATFTYTPPVVTQTLTFANSTVDSLPKTLSGSTTGFGSDALTFRLGNPTTGTVLASTGTSSVTVTFSACLAAGNHTVYAVGAAGRQASATVNVTVSCMLSLNLQNRGSTAGLLEATDRVIVTYNRALNLSTVCSGWSGNALSVTATLDVDTAKNNPANSKLATSASGCGTFRFGTIDLGTPGFADKDVTFESSTLTWDATGNTLTLVLGTPCTAGGSCGTRSTVSGSSTATYTPASGLTAGGTAVTGTATRTGTQF